MVKKLLELLRRRTYSSKQDKEEFKRDSKENLEKRVKKEISNLMDDNSYLHNKEKQQRIEIEVLVDILKENPDYYTESEINKICFEILE